MDSPTGSSRERSKLAVDDPDYCKRCGAKIPFNDSRETFSRDADGVPSVVYEGEVVQIERCPECWLKRAIDRQLLYEAAARYEHNAIPEVFFGDE